VVGVVDGGTDEAGANTSGDVVGTDVAAPTRDVEVVAGRAVGGGAVGVVGRAVAGAVAGPKRDR
jgi:hypothetical protein